MLLGRGKELGRSPIKAMVMNIIGWPAGQPCCLGFSIFQLLHGYPGHAG